MKNSALVVIDLQNDITKNYKEIIENVNEAIDWAVRKDLWVVYIQHNNLSAGTRTFKPGTRGAEPVAGTKSPLRISLVGSGAGAGAERRVRPYLYEDKKQRPDQ